MEGRVPRILIVDDEQLLCWTLPRVFEEAGYQPTCCATVKEALAMMRMTAFDLLITDYRLPDGSGIEVAAFAKDLIDAPGVIMMTAEPEHRLNMPQDTNIDTIVMKPFDIDVLVKKARALVQAGVEPTDMQL